MELEADPDENERICRDEEENTNEYTQKGWNKSRNRNTKNEIIKIYWDKIIRDIENHGFKSPN